MQDKYRTSDTTDALPTTPSPHVHVGPTLTDRDVLDDHGLRRARLVKALTHGDPRGHQPQTSLALLMAFGLIPAALIIVVVVIADFISTRL